MTRAAVALIAFVALAGLVTVGALADADRAILDLVQRPEASWLDLAASVVTTFGQSEVVGTIALGVTIARLRARRPDWWVPLLLAVVVAIEFVLKFTIPQAPPPEELARSIRFVPFIEGPRAFAFPSGHVARVAFLVAALRWPTGVSATAILVMALSRIYLAEHWPSDVLGGWLLGYSIAAAGRERA